MKITEIGLREKKKAKQKWDILQCMVEALKTKSFNNIKIEDLCHSLSISKVTFFNYFDSKEQVLSYFISSWEYSTYYELLDKKLKGIDALSHILKSISKREEGLNIMLAISQFLIKSDKMIANTITPYEFYLFSKNAYESNHTHTGILNFTLKIIEDFNLNQVNSSKVLRQLIVGFYGVPMWIKTESLDTLEDAYDGLLDDIAANIAYLKSK